jgi:hypothetical protein
MKRNPTLTCAELNSLGCDKPDCTHDHTVVYLHQRCHPDAGAWARFDKGTGVLTIECKECGKSFVNILVANHGEANDEQPVH